MKFDQQNLFSMKMFLAWPSEASILLQTYPCMYFCVHLFFFFLVYAFFVFWIFVMNLGVHFFGFYYFFLFFIYRYVHCIHKQRVSNNGRVVLKKVTLRGLNFLETIPKTCKNYQAYSCPRDWRVCRQSWVLIEPPETPRTSYHHGIEGLKGDSQLG